MCKACYIRIADAEVNGEGYEPIGDDNSSFEEVKNTIIDRQIDFLKNEHLPAPKEIVRIGRKKYFMKTRLQPTRYLMPKLHKKVIKFRSITSCSATTNEGISRMVHASLAGMLPTLHSLWREAGSKIGIFSDGCWICKDGDELFDIARNADRASQSARDRRPHTFETYDFVGMYTNIPLSVLLVKTREILDLVFDFQESRHGYKSIFIEYSFKDNSPLVRDDNCSWSKKEPVKASDENPKTTSFYIGRERLFKWIEFVLGEGYVQFGPKMFRQSSGIFMGSSFAPDLANYFGFMHEYPFYLEMIEEFSAARVGNRPSLYPFAFIEQFGTMTKRYIDDIITISLASQQGGLGFQDIIFSGNRLFILTHENDSNWEYIYSDRTVLDENRVMMVPETLGGMYDKWITDWLETEYLPLFL